MNGKVAIIVIAVIVVAVVGVIYLDHESRVEYCIDADDAVEVLGTVTFTVTAELDEAMTVTLWCDNENLTEGRASVSETSPPTLNLLPPVTAESCFYTRTAIESYAEERERQEVQEGQGQSPGQVFRTSGRR